MAGGTPWNAEHRRATGNGREQGPRKARRSVSAAWYRYRCRVGIATVLLAIAGYCEAEAQQAVRVGAARTGPSEVRLGWEGESGYFEVQRTLSLAEPDWEMVQRTPATSTTIRPGGGTEFFRVVTLPEWSKRIVPEVRRMEILDAVSKFIGPLPGEDGNADASAMVKFLERIPELEGIGVSPDTSVFARFTDGRPLMIINNRPPATEAELSGVIDLSVTNEPSTRASTGNIRPMIHAQAVQRPYGIPESRRAVLFEATVPGLPAPMRQELIPGFESRGYVLSGGEASLPNLMAVEGLGDDIGVFYIDSHGGIGEESHAVASPEGGRGLFRAKPMFVLMSSTVVTAESEELYQSAFDRGELIYAFTGPAIRAGGIRIVPKPYYCITSRFVRNRWQFGRRSLVYIDTCDSAHAGAASFIRTCLDKGGTAYAGWTDSVQDVWAHFATEVFFDTLFGGNPILTYIQPKQRAFDRTAVHDYMKSKGWDVDRTKRSVGARLVFFPDLPAPGGFGLLAPSIQQMYAGSEPGVVNIYGLFDPSVPATVRIEGGGTFEAMPQSRSELIIPWSGRNQPSAGQVTVLQREHPSNTIPLSEWRVKMRMVNRLTAFRQEPRANVDFNLHVRADVHAFRLIPYGKSIAGSTSGIAEPDSTCRVMDAFGIFDEGRVQFEWALPAPVDVPWVWYFDPVGARGFKARVTFRRDEGRVQFEVAASAADTAVVTATPDEGEAYTYRASPVNAGTHSGTGGPMDESFTIQAGDDSSTTGAKGPFGSRFSWDAATATFPPRRSNPGYAE